MDKINIILTDNPQVFDDLLPLTYTRPISALRPGILTLAERWQRLLPGNYGYGVCRDYLAEKFPCPPMADPVSISSEVVATEPLARAVAALAPGQSLVEPDGQLIAWRQGAEEILQPVVYQGEVRRIRRPYHIFMEAQRAVAEDFDILCSGRTSQPLSPTNTVVGNPAKVFLEEGARAECAVFNVNAGPIYIGRDAEVMEGALLRGPVALCPHAVVNMGAKIYGATVLGPYCKVGGELNNVVMTGYSNKAHDGFLGNAVIGEWCNLGAGCVASNLKNNYSPIKLWSYPARRFVPTGLQFCGLIMGDHSKAGINTMFNTATVIGVGVNIHQAGFPRAFVPSFSDGGSSSGFTDVPLAPFLETARRMMARRGIELTEADERMFAAIRAAAEQYK